MALGSLTEPDWSSFFMLKRIRLYIFLAYVQESASLGFGPLWEEFFSNSIFFHLQSIQKHGRICVYCEGYLHKEVTLVERVCKDSLEFSVRQQHWVRYFREVWVWNLSVKSSWNSICWSSQLLISYSAGLVSLCDKGVFPHLRHVLITPTVFLKHMGCDMEGWAASFVFCHGGI